MRALCFSAAATKCLMICISVQFIILAVEFSLPNVIKMHFL